MMVLLSRVNMESSIIVDGEVFWRYCKALAAGGRAVMLVPCLPEQMKLLVKLKFSKDVNLRPIGYVSIVAK